MDQESQITHMSAYLLSKVYAEGWNRAHELSAPDRAQVDLCGPGVLNPYGEEPQRARWAEGFTKAFGV
jgi:hypothetical protein